MILLVDPDFAKSHGVINTLGACELEILKLAGVVYRNNDFSIIDEWHGVILLGVDNSPVTEIVGAFEFPAANHVFIHI